MNDFKNLFNIAIRDNLRHCEGFVSYPYGQVCNHFNMVDTDTNRVLLVNNMETLHELIKLVEDGVPVAAFGLPPVEYTGKTVQVIEKPVQVCEQVYEESV